MTEDSVRTKNNSIYALSFGVIRVLRLLRALRPLRVINRAPGVKLVVMTLISSLKPIGNIVLITGTFFIIFGILGVQLFKASGRTALETAIVDRQITHQTTQYYKMSVIAVLYAFH